MSQAAMAVAVAVVVGTLGKKRPGSIRKSRSSGKAGKSGKTLTLGKNGQLPGRVEVGKIGKRTIEW